jgi:hypothetical protein
MVYFQIKKSKFGKISDVLEMEDSGIFYRHLVNLPTIWYILLHYGILCGHLVYFTRFDILYNEKIWQLCFII